MEEKIKLLEETINKFDFLQDYKPALEKIKVKFNQNKIYLVLTGEFSSGKTSLINSLFNLNLPVNVLPETSSIWKILKGDIESILVYLKDGSVKSCANIDEVKTIPPQEIQFIEYTLPKAPDDIVIVDTPGLSSLNEDHKRVLEEFIEEADVLAVVIDVNQGLTKTTEKFIQEQLDKGSSIFIVLSKIDTKPPSAVRSLENFLKRKFPEYSKGIFKVSAKNGDIKEFEALINVIKQEKLKILNQKLHLLINRLCSDILNTLKVSLGGAQLDLTDIEKKEQEIEIQLKQLEKKLREIKRNIDLKLTEAIYISTNTFKNYLFERVDWILNALYDRNLNEDVEQRLKPLIEEAIRYSLKVLQENIKSIEADLEGELLKLKNNFSLEKDLSYIISDILVRFSEDILNLVTIILTIIPIGKILKPLIPIISKALGSLIKSITGSHIKQKILSSIEEMAESYKNELMNLVNKHLDDIYKEFTQEIETQRQVLKKTLDELKHQKKKRQEEFNNFKSNLENTIQKLETICGGFKNVSKYS